MSLGIYLHIPFCQTKCNYCHFISLPFHRGMADRYRAAVLGEMRSFSSRAITEEVDSIYFGGGTPSLVPSEHITGILRECQGRFHISHDCEVSMEANPGTLSAEKVAAYRNAGINRISIGAQSFVDQELSAIGRTHTAEMIVESIDLLRSRGFVNINLDLMLGLPMQTEESWRKNLEAVARASAPHISVYMLDLDDHCPLHSLIANGLIQVPEEDLISDLYLETIDFLASCGYLQYEISNFAYPGHSCHHNLKYWMREPVQGFGLGSHSFDRNSRYANCSMIEDYLNAIESGCSPVSWREPVTPAHALEETLFLGLRLSQGVNWSQLRSGHSSCDLSKYEDSLRELSGRGLLEWKDSVVRLTASGMLVSNEIFQLFV
jgi:oxygen-independent coproporphyrinogen-3 oxidase